MGYILKELPDSEKPRERLARYGAASLSNIELIAIILRTGYKEKSVLSVANDLLKSLEEIKYLGEITIEELKMIPGIGMTKSIELIAAIELGRRVCDASTESMYIKTPRDSYEYLKNNMQNYTQETFICIFLNIKGKIISKKIISLGTLSNTLIHPREIFKWALKYSAYGIVLAHNHPSGDPKPSSDDIKITKKVIDAGNQMGIEIIDHIIVGNKKYFSFLENKLLF